MMERIDTPLDGLVLLRPRIFGDDRGHFLETFNQRAFNSLIGEEITFVQDNESVSTKDVLRGLHLQTAPHQQGKLVHVVSGAVLDVCLDIRPSSATFGQHYKVRLDGSTKELLWIPPGFAHGFVALEDRTIFAYKCTAYYQPSAERTILWNDPELGIEWGVERPLISPKDLIGGTFRHIMELS
ncbi:MAG: dTDP-4-dehydrorhamnose 3,5-epimerase [Flavobacteriales bacterium]